MSIKKYIILIILPFIIYNCYIIQKIYAYDMSSLYDEEKISINESLHSFGVDIYKYKTRLIQKNNNINQIKNGYQSSITIPMPLNTINQKMSLKVLGSVTEKDNCDHANSLGILLNFSPVEKLFLQIGFEKGHRNQYTKINTNIQNIKYNINEMISGFLDTSYQKKYNKYSFYLSYLINLTKKNNNTSTNAFIETGIKPYIVEKMDKINNNTIPFHIQQNSTMFLLTQKDIMCDLIINFHLQLSNHLKFIFGVEYPILQKHYMVNDTKKSVIESKPNNWKTNIGIKMSF